MGIHNFEFGILKKSKVEDLKKFEYEFIKHYYNINRDIIYNNFIKNSDNKIVRSNLILDSQLIDNIVHDLKYTKIPYKKLSEKYGYSEATLYDFNVGYYYKLNGLDYPIRKHKSEVKYTNYKLICNNCNKEFQNTNKKTKYCSEDCFEENKLKNSIVVYDDFIIRNGIKIEKLDLYTKLKNSNFEKVSKKYHVSSNALRKWCDLLGISRYSKDYK